MFIRRVLVSQRSAAAVDFISLPVERNTLFSMGNDFLAIVGRREKPKGWQQLNFLSSN